MMSYEEFKEAFKKIKAKGFVPAQRKGDTGVGHTLEQLIGLEENNIALPDLGTAELKGHRINSTSMITLFTYDRNVWIKNSWEAIQEYGTPDKNGRLGMYFTLTKSPNRTGLFVRLDDNYVLVCHTSGEIIAKWEVSKLVERFRTKIPSNLILVSACSEIRDQKEWFHYIKASLLKSTSPEIIRDQINAENLRVDLRLHDDGTCARNHGTGFRVLESKLEFLFSKIEEIE